MRLPITRVACFFATVFISLGTGPKATAQEQTPFDFENDVLPILEDNCFRCHGPRRQRSNFRVDQLASLMRGGDSGEAGIVPHDPDASYLLKTLTGESDGERMPLGEDPLLDEEIELIRRWIESGAQWPGQEMPDAGDNPFLEHDHWSLKPITNPPVPEAEGEGDRWAGGAIDAFVLERLVAAGLEPSPQAARHTLIRRVFFTLHGLAPTPEQTAQYLEDERDDWYERMVDDLLESPRYGERWARHWLDIVRYAETTGFETNVPRPNAYHYRDYVIRAFNADTPYDRFILDQLAGDTTGEDAATGFLVAGTKDIVSSPDPALTAMQRSNELADMVNVTSGAFMGLTVACARCHNHKFDPILQTDYYAMEAVFAGVIHGERDIPRDAETVTQTLESLRLVELQLDHYEPLARTTEGDAAARFPVNARRNVERFAPVQARYIRFVVESTNNAAEPCIDELEVYATPDSDGAFVNVALASNGGVASSSGSYAGNPYHQLEHINDGQYGNPRSWISDEREVGWVAIELPQVQTIDRVVWGRDRQQAYTDRLPTRYRVEVAVEPGQWKVVARGDDRAASVADLPTADRPAAWQALEAQRQALQASLRGSRVYAGVFVQPPTTHRLYRGDPGQPREVVVPSTITVLGSLELDANEPEQNRRLAFAQSLVDPDHPLTARVMVNRIWQYHLGEGLVSTPSDLGRMGAPATHPELLDYLASRFIESGWSIKQMHRLILNSNTFQQDSAPRPDAMQIDSQSALLWRFPPRRHEAEVIRDNILLASGKIDFTMFGPGFDLFLPNENYVRVYEHKRSFRPEDWRRMVYAHSVRMERDLTFGSFDCPDGGQSTPKRTRSTTALQALSLFNSPFVLDQAVHFADRLRDEAGTELQDQVQRAYVLLYGRGATETELSDCISFSEEFGLEALCRVLFNTNEFLFVQ